MDGRDVLRFRHQKICARIIPACGLFAREPDAIVNENDRALFDRLGHASGETEPVLGRFVRIIIGKYYDDANLLLSMMRADPTFRVTVPGFTFNARANG